MLDSCPFDVSGWYCLVPRWLSSECKVYVDTTTLVSLRRAAAATRQERIRQIGEAWVLPLLEEHECREQFLRLCDTAGTITKKSFVTAMVAAHLQPEDACSLFKSLDQDGVEEISWTQFLATSLSRQVCRSSDVDIPCAWQHAAKNCVSDSFSIELVHLSPLSLDLCGNGTSLLSPSSGPSSEEVDEPVAPPNTPSAGGCQCSTSDLFFDARSKDGCSSTDSSRHLEELYEDSASFLDDSDVQCGAEDESMHVCTVLQCLTCARRRDESVPALPAQEPQFEGSVLARVVVIVYQVKDVLD